MIFALLCALALLDGGFAGYRAAAGRNALVVKTRYYQRAVVHGLVVAALNLVVIAVVAGLCLLLSSNPAALHADFAIAGEKMLLVFIPYSLAVVLTFLPFVCPWADVRVLTSVIIFGPFTLLRPFVAAGGLIFGLITKPRVEVALVCAAAVAVSLAMEPILGRRLPPEA